MRPSLIAIGGALTSLAGAAMRTCAAASDSTSLLSAYRCGKSAGILPGQDLMFAGHCAGCAVMALGAVVAAYGLARLAPTAWQRVRQRA